jgi:hypothetical protein
MLTTFTDNGTTDTWKGKEPVIHVYGSFGGGTLQVYTAPINDDFRLTGATIAAGGTGYGISQTFDVTLVGGEGIVAIVNVTCDADGIVDTVNSVTATGSYKGKPSNPIATTGGTGSGLTLNGTFSDNWTTLLGGAVTANAIIRPPYSIRESEPMRIKATLSGATTPNLNVKVL